MITPATRSTVSMVAVVSLAAIATTTLALGACARAPSHVAWDAPAPAQDQPLTIRFDNEGEVYVDVYLIGEQREWWLGRLAPGVEAKLRIPEAAQVTTSGFVRLAVIAGAQRSAQAARDPRATFSLAQPAPALMSQRWSFWQTQLTTPQILGVPVARR